MDKHPPESTPNAIMITTPLCYNTELPCNNISFIDSIYYPGCYEYV